MTEPRDNGHAVGGASPEAPAIKDGVSSPWAETGSDKPVCTCTPEQTGEPSVAVVRQSQEANPSAQQGGRLPGDSRSLPNRPNVYGALDLGTNNCRLLVATPSRRGFRVIDAFSRIIRLGEGISRSGKLSTAAMTRTIDALKVCSEKMERRGVQRARLIATEACRIAENGAEFLGLVRSETGLELEVVTRETEAKLAVSGCASLLDRQSDRALVFDIGGGSSELIWLDLKKHAVGRRRSVHGRIEAQNCIVGWTSLPVGVVTLAERYGGRHVTREVFESMVRDVVNMLRGFEEEHQISAQLASQRVQFLGTSGTVTTVAGIHLGLPHYDRSRVDGCWLDADEVRGVFEDLAGMSYEERVAQPCVGRDRADLVLAGCAILEALLRAWSCDRLRVADRGLREGILAMLMAEDGHMRPIRDGRGRRGKGGKGGKGGAGRR